MQESKKDQRLVVLTDKKQMESLRVLSKKTGAPIGELVRRAVDSYLKEQKQQDK